jgi:hypothetical protein
VGQAPTAPRPSKCIEMGEPDFVGCLPRVCIGSWDHEPPRVFDLAAAFGVRRLVAAVSCPAAVPKRRQVAALQTLCAVQSSGRLAACRNRQVACSTPKAFSKDALTPRDSARPSINHCKNSYSIDRVRRGGAFGGRWQAQRDTALVPRVPERYRSQSARTFATRLPVVEVRETDVRSRAFHWNPPHHLHPLPLGRGEGDGGVKLQSRSAEIRTGVEQATGLFRRATSPASFWAAGCRPGRAGSPFHPFFRQTLGMSFLCEKDGGLWWEDLCVHQSPPDVEPMTQCPGKSFPQEKAGTDSLIGASAGQAS